MITALTAAATRDIATANDDLEALRDQITRNRANARRRARRAEQKMILNRRKP